jgi:Tol biopolymer transport system component
LLNQADVRQHSDERGGSIAFNGAVSPDGNLIAAAAQNGNMSSIAIMPFGPDRATIAPRAPIERDCRYESPSWLPNGSGIVFAANCNGKFGLYRADLKIDDPISGYGATLVNVRSITNSPNFDNYFPRVSPDGSKVLFGSNRNGNGDIYVINIDGSGERRLTDDPADDGAATWAANGFEIAFDSNRDGDYDIYRTTLDNPGVVKKMTENSVDDRWPLWEQ